MVMAKMENKEAWLQLPEAERKMYTKMYSEAQGVIKKADSVASANTTAQARSRSTAPTVPGDPFSTGQSRSQSQAPDSGAPLLNMATIGRGGMDDEPRRGEGAKTGVVVGTSTNIEANKMQKDRNRARDNRLKAGRADDSELTPEEIENARLQRLEDEELERMGRGPADEGGMVPTANQAGSYRVGGKAAGKYNTSGPKAGAKMGPRAGIFGTIGDVFDDIF
jgi:hypothetical protein